MHIHMQIFTCHKFFCPTQDVSPFTVKSTLTVYAPYAAGLHAAFWTRTDLQTIFEVTSLCL